MRAKIYFANAAEVLSFAAFSFNNKHMLRSELIDILASENPHLRTSDIEKIVNTVFDTITEALRDGNRVELRGFGAFSVRTREARKGRNPRTGETVDVPSKSVPFFKAGKELRALVNGGEDPESR